MVSIVTQCTALYLTTNQYKVGQHCDLPINTKTGSLVTHCTAVYLTTNQYKDGLHCDSVPPAMTAKNIEKEFARRPVRTVRDYWQTAKPERPPVGLSHGGVFVLTRRHIIESASSGGRNLFRLFAARRRDVSTAWQS